MLHRLLRQNTGQTIAPAACAAHMLHRLTEQRWARLAAFAAVAALGPAYALAAPPLLADDSNLRSAAAIQPSASAPGGVPAREPSEPAASSDAGGTSTSNQSSATLDLSVSSSGGSHTSVTVNGNQAVAPPDGTLSQRTVSDDGTMSVNISSSSSSATGRSNSVSSLDVDLQSESSGG